MIYSDSDYRYRAWLAREAWAEALAELGRRIDYPNVKRAVFERQGASRYEQAMHEVWSVLARTQPGGPYGDGGSGWEQARPRRSTGGGR